MPDNQPNSSPDTKRNQSVFAVMKSSAAAMLGVQSKKNLEEDFSNGKLSHYIIAGIVGATLFVLTVWGIVKLVSSLVIPPQ